MIFTMFIITDTIQVRTITFLIIPLQSGGALSSWPARNTSTEFYTHRRMTIEMCCELTLTCDITHLVGKPSSRLHISAAEYRQLVTTCTHANLSWIKGPSYSALPFGQDYFCQKRCNVTQPWMVGRTVWVLHHLYFLKTFAL